MAETLKMRIGAPTSSQYYVPGTSYYASSTDSDKKFIYIGKHSSNEPNGFARCVYPSVLQYLKNQGIVSGSKKIKVTSANFAGRNASGKTMSLNIRINNNNTDDGQNDEGVVLSTTAYGGGNPVAYSNVEWQITDSTVLEFLATTTNPIVVHVYPSKYTSSSYVAISTSKHGAEWGPRLNVTYEIVEDSGSEGGGGDDDDDSGTTTTPTVNFNNTSMGSISDIDYGNTLSCTISNIPSNSKLSYKWWFKKPDGSFYLQDSDTTDASDKLVLKWKPDIDVGDYFSSSSKTQTGKLEVAIENPNAGNNTFSGTSHFTVTLTDSFGPTVPIVSIGSTHTSGSYIPGSGIIWSASSTAQERATIKEYTFSINGRTDTVNSSSVKNQIAYILPSNEGTYTATITVTDSRGFTASTTRNITVSSKIAPTINASVIRCDKDGVEDPVEGAYFLLNGTISADQTGGTNYITSVMVVITQTVRDADDKVVTEKRTLSDSPSLTKEYNLSRFEVQQLPYSTDPEKKLSSFDIVITAIDSKGTPAERILYGPAAAYIIHIAVGGKSLGLGSKAGLDKTITCGWNLISGGDLTVNGSVILKSQPLAVKYGGTGATTEAGARDSLGITQAINEEIGKLNLTNYASKNDLENCVNNVTNLSNNVTNLSTNMDYIVNNYASKAEVPKIYYQTTKPTSGSYGDIWLEPI